MDPNSSHQLWSKWTVVIGPLDVGKPAATVVEANTAKIFRALFGAAGQVRVRQLQRVCVVQALVDSGLHPHDPADFDAMRRKLSSFFKQGFGAGAGVYVKARLMAGIRIDGQPPDQMLILPRLAIPADVARVWRQPGVI